MDNMVIFTRTLDLLLWLIPRVETFPKNQRFIISKRLTDAVLDFQEALFDANARRGRDRLSHLQSADAHLNKVRLYLQLAFRFQWLTSGQYEHVSQMVAEIGRLLGGWMKQTRG